MSKKFDFLCGEIKDNTVIPSNANLKYLSFHGEDRNIHFGISCISQKMLKSVPGLFLDLLELAAYVYSADQSASRGGNDISFMDKHWRRKMVLHIPVRELTVWKKPKVITALRKALNFISDDEYQFVFRQYKTVRPAEQYFEFLDDEINDVEEVLLYSGGLDSLAGAVDEIVNKKQKVILVNHNSSTVRQGNIRTLNEKFDKYYRDNKPYHVPVSLHQIGKDSSDNSQRTRSFLYISIAAAISKMIGLNRIKIFENGIISFNLPILGQLTGAKATRTAHPKTVRLIADFISDLSGEPFEIETPFKWFTKADVVKVIRDTGCGELIQHTRSCSRVRNAKKEHPHCGTCIQCIDRRFAVLSAGCEEFDPADKYGVDLMKGERKEGESITIAESYVKFTKKISSIFNYDDPGRQFFSVFPEVHKILPSIKGSYEENKLNILNLYERHSQQVYDVVKKEACYNFDNYFFDKLPESSILAMAYRKEKHVKKYRKEKEKGRKMSPSEGSPYGEFKNSSTDIHEFLHTDEYSSVMYDEILYTFNSRQSQVIEILHRFFLAGIPYLKQDKILVEIGAGPTVRLAHVFQDSPAWKILIVPHLGEDGKRKGFYKLNL